MSKAVWILLFGVFYSISITRAKTAKPPPTWLKPKAKPTPIPSTSKYKAPMISKPKTSPTQPIRTLKKPKTNGNKDILNKTFNFIKENLEDQTTPEIKSEDKKSIGSEKEIVVELEATEYISDNFSNPDAVQKNDDKAMKEKIKISEVKNEKILSKIESALLKSVAFNKDKLSSRNTTENSDKQVPSMIPIFRSTLVNRKKTEDLKEKIESSIEFQKATPTEKPKNKDETKILDERQKLNQSLIFQLFENLNLKHGSAVVPVHNYKLQNSENSHNEKNSEISIQNSNNQKIEDAKLTFKQDFTDETALFKFNAVKPDMLQIQQIQKMNLTEENYLDYTSLAGTNNLKPMMLSFIPITQIPSHNLYIQKGEDVNSSRNSYENSIPLVKTREMKPVIINFIPMNQIPSQNQQHQKETDENLLSRQENYQNSALSARSNDMKHVLLNFIPMNQTTNLIIQQQDVEDKKIKYRQDNIEYSTSLPKSDDAKQVSLNSLVQHLNQNLKLIDERPLSNLELGENSTPFGRSDVKPNTLHFNSRIQNPNQNTQYTDNSENFEKRPIILNLLAQNPSSNIQNHKTLYEKPLYHRQNNYENAPSLVNADDMKLELFNLNSAQKPNQNLIYQKVVDVTPIFKNIVTTQECGKNGKRAILKNSVIQNPSQSIQNKNFAEVKPMLRQEICGNSASLAQMNTAKSAIVNFNSIAQNPSHNIQCQQNSDASIVSTDYESSNKANLVLYKPETVSLLNTYGDFLKELTMTVLVPFHVSSL